MNRFLVAVCAALAVTGCGRAPDLLKENDWRESTENREEVDKAAELCNNILAPELSRLKLRTVWSNTKGGVPIYLVGLSNLTWSDMLFVPEEDEAIVIGRPQLDAFFAKYLKNPEDRPRLLALFLLHELGHIHHGDGGSYAAPGSTGLNTDGTEQKHKEEAADKFAVDQVRDGLQADQPVPRFTASISVGNALGMFSFNVNTSALVQDFGGRSRNRFWDMGYTHPNFERRLLAMQHALAPSAASAELLRQFDEDRNAAGKPRVFQREPTLRLFEMPERETE